ncbi:MAG: hypothetical protein ABR540_04170, partial [Acidimicrobiales bacterium]
MTVVVAADRGGDLVARLQPLIRMLVPEVQRWMDEQSAQTVEERRYQPFVAIAEQFDDLLSSVNWVAECFGRTRGWQPDPPVFEAAVSLAGLVVAAREASPHAFRDGSVPSEVIEVFLAVWLSELARRPDVTAPQIAAAYLSGSWSPPGTPVCDAFWEPAGLLLEALVYKSACHGLHRLANLRVPPLACERKEERSVFNQRIVEATHTVTVWTSAPPAQAAVDAGTIQEWDCEKLTLWEFLAGVILGPGRARRPGDGGAADGERPQAGAFPQTLLGRWGELEMGLIAATVELYVCTGCAKFHQEPSCEAFPSAAMVATWRRHQFLTPRDRLPAPQRHLG